MEQLVTMTDLVSPAHSPGPICPGEPLVTGELLGGRYRITRFIAAGGMGQVYAADDHLLGEAVAVKQLRRDLVRKPGAQQRFADEFRFARRVTHPNVSRVFDVGIDGERVYYTMELHPGHTLKTHFADVGRMSIATVKPLAGQILAGLGAAHDAEVVHADLKPSNVLFSKTGRVLVSDFGLALPLCATLGCACDMPHLIGTPAYMAPEQVTGGTVLEGTDLFSFGVILFELLTGRLPWYGADAISMANARLTGITPPPRRFVRDLDPTWDDVIVACLQRDLSDRPKTAAEVARALGVT